MEGGHRGDRSEVAAGRRAIRAGVGVRVPAEPRPGIVGPPEERVDAGQALVQLGEGVAVRRLDLGLVEARRPDRVLASARMVHARAAPVRQALEQFAPATAPARAPGTPHPARDREGSRACAARGPRAVRPPPDRPRAGRRPGRRSGRRPGSSRRIPGTGRSGSVRRLRSFAASWLTTNRTSQRSASRAAAACATRANSSRSGVP